MPLDESARTEPPVLFLYDYLSCYTIDENMFSRCSDGFGAGRAELLLWLGEEPLAPAIISEYINLRPSGMRDSGSWLYGFSDEPPKEEAYSSC